MQFIIELKPEFLETLAVGEHIITIKFKDGDPVFVTVNIQPKQEGANAESNAGDKAENNADQPQGPKTADAMPQIYLFTLLAMSAVSVAVLYRKHRREEA